MVRAMKEKIKKNWMIIAACAWALAVIMSGGL
jgi:hypothetical protein